MLSMRYLFIPVPVIVCATILCACSEKDKAVLTGKGTAVDTFEFKPKTAAEMSAPMASAPRAAIDDFHFKPKTAAEMSKPVARPASARPAAIDTFVFVPKTAAELSAPQKAR